MAFVRRLSVLILFLAICASISLGGRVALWELGMSSIIPIGIVSVGYLVSLAIYTLFQNRFSENIAVRLIWVGVLFICVVSGVLAYIYFFDVGISRLSISIALGYLLAALLLSILLARQTLIVSVLAIILLLYGLEPTIKAAGSKTNLESDQQASYYVSSSYHDLKLTSYNVKSNFPQDGGAIASIGDFRGVLVTGDGLFYSYSVENNNVVLNRLNLKSPLDVDGYYKKANNPNRWYRILDAYIDQPSGSPPRIYLTYTHWDEQAVCYTIRLSSAQLEIADGNVTAIDKDELEWQTLFESQPCLAHDIANNETGGRIAALSDDLLLFSVGSFKLGKIDHTLFSTASYGKLFTIDTHTFETAIYSTGHRNPQGIVVTEDGVWETEHGPFGGGELNRIKQGYDYGWPYQSYGTDYGYKTLALTKTHVGDHSAAERPIFSWTPSIGISSIIQIKNNAFSNWKNDFLIGSLNGLGQGYSIYRTRVRDGRVITPERINIKNKVRDLIELGDGKLLIWDGKGRLLLASPSESVFSACSGCHALRDSTNGIGPDLWGVINRKVAFHKTYDYSDSLRSFGGKWTISRLDKFLQDPKAQVPGTTMDFPGIKDPATRKEIIEYLYNIQQSR